MALDGIFLRLVKERLMPLVGGRVEKIHQPSREEILFTIRTREGRIGCCLIQVQVLQEYT